MSLPPYDKYVVYYVQNNRPTACGCCVRARMCVCVFDTWSTCTIQVHSFRCYYYTSETLAKKSSKAQLWEAHRDNQWHRRQLGGGFGGCGRGEEQQEGKERLESGRGGCRSEDSQAVGQVKAKTTDDSPIRMLHRADLANQSPIPRLDGATILVSNPAHHYWHHFVFLHNLNIFRNKCLCLLFAVYYLLGRIKHELSFKNKCLA